MVKVDLSRRTQIGRDRRARSRKQLVEAARALFSARPHESITVEEVASAAGLAKGTFYLRFQSLDELWAAGEGSRARVGADFRPGDEQARGCAGTNCHRLRRLRRTRS
jgi:hypothetical protein